MATYIHTYITLHTYTHTYIHTTHLKTPNAVNMSDAVKMLIIVVVIIIIIIIIIIIFPDMPCMKRVYRDK